MRAIALILGLLLTSACTQMMVIDGEMVSGGRTKASIVLEVLQKGLCEGDEATINQYVAEDYKQHNPMAEDGRAGLLAFVRSLKGVEVRIEIRRVLCDGDYVAVHTDAWFGDSHSAVFDLFIVRDGMLREHWDCIQAVPEKTVSGRSMTDGPTEVSNRNRTETNRRLVTEMMNDLMLTRRYDLLQEYVADDFAQHNPEFADGFSGFLKGMFVEEGVRFLYNKLHRVIAEGNFVLSQSEGESNGKRVALYELWRIENGKIVEHWDTIQEVPATSKNKNGMF
jgi:predicted SnoaL-like aldol condensation-catalyzing enzyme